MKTTHAVVAILVIAMGNAPALGTDYTFDATSGTWDNTDNWSPTGTPEAGDSATIPDEKICVIESGGQPAYEECDWIDVQSGGELRIVKGSTLTISEDSLVNGLVTILAGPQDPSKLLIAANLTIEGQGGEIVMSGAVIDDNGVSTYRLTIMAGAGACTPPGERCSVLVRGGGSDIKVKLTNHAYVRADGNDAECTGTNDPITLSENAKNGTGVWGATEAGHLLVDTEVTGTGSWVMGDADSRCAEHAKITIDDCTRVQGTVYLEHGTFVVNERFCTRGDLTWKSETNSSPSGTSSPTIDVEATTLARFGIVSCQTCD